MSRGRSFLVLLCHARVAQDGARLSAALLGVDDAEHGLPHRVERTEPGDQDRRHVEMGCIRPGTAPSAQKGWGLESAGSADCLSQRAPLHVAARAARISRLIRVRTPTLLRAWNLSRLRRGSSAG